MNNREIGDIWIDEFENEFVIKDVQGNIIISESVGEIENEPEE